MSRPVPNRRRLQRPAFTLVEAMVVLGIIVTLMGLLFVGLRGVTATSRSVACLNNMRNIGATVLSYTNVNDGHYPISSHTTGSVTSKQCWMNTLGQLGATGTLCCCPSDQFAEQRKTSYAMNDYLEPLTPGIDYDPITGGTLPDGRTDAITTIQLVPSPAATVLFVETPGQGLIDHIHAVGWTTADEIKDWVAVERHGEGANYLFADGHAGFVQWMRLSKGFTPQTSVFNPATAN